MLFVGTCLQRRQGMNALLPYPEPTVPFPKFSQATHHEKAPTGGIEGRPCMRLTGATALQLHHELRECPPLPSTTVVPVFKRMKS